MSDDLKKIGFFTLPILKRCSSTAHNPPTHIYIPAGMGYRHVCPQCGKESVIYSSEPWLGTPYTGDVDE